MSERGVFAVDRGIWDHESFAKDPFTEREAFIWLVGEASYRPRKSRVGSVVVELQRGQAAHSYRFMAERWKWSLGKVQRFLRRLEIDTIIRTQSDTGSLVVTICNYDKYQKVSLPSDTPSDTGGDTPPIRDRYRLEDRKYKENIPSETSSLRGEHARLLIETDGAKPPSKKRGSRLPDDWWPDEDLKAYARDRLPDGRSCQQETEKFKNYWRAAAGRNAVKLDWGLTYQNWILRAAENYSRPGPTGARDAPRRNGSDKLKDALDTLDPERFGYGR